MSHGLYICIVHMGVHTHANTINTLCIIRNSIYVMASTPCFNTEKCIAPFLEIKKFKTQMGSVCPRFSGEMPVGVGYLVCA